MLDIFSQKWTAIKQGVKEADERSLFVEPGKEPITQRQLNLYYYFLFIKDILQKNDSHRILEMGCGRGTMALYLTKYLGFNLTLLDYAAEAIDLARTLFAENNCQAEFVIGDALQTNFPDESFDAIVSIGLAEHFDKVDELLREQHRLLKKGGVMISLNIPQKFSIQFLNTIMRLVKKIFGSYKESVKKDYYRNRFKPKVYQNFAQKAGFKEVQIIHVNPFPIYTPVGASFDRKVTKLNKSILWLRSLLTKYPYKTNYLLSQAHFLVGYKY